MKVREISGAKNEEKNNNSKNELTLQDLYRAEEDMSVLMSEGLRFYYPSRGRCFSLGPMQIGVLDRDLSM